MVLAVPKLKLSGQINAVGSFGREMPGYNFSMALEAMKELLQNCPKLLSGFKRPAVGAWKEIAYMRILYSTNKFSTTVLY